MSSIRKIAKITKSIPTSEGAGVRIRRAFGFSQTPDLDPFLLLDDFKSSNPEDYVKGFPWHPHRGIETITYMLYGEIEHQDSMGNKGIIKPQEVQWMTAGSGIIHQEMPISQGSQLFWGFQLWANLPKSHKMMDPRYREVTKEEIPEINLKNGVKIYMISGQIGDIKGPVQDVVSAPEYLDVTIPPNTEFEHKIDANKTVFAYVIDGKGFFDDCRDPYDVDITPNKYLEFERKCKMGANTLVKYKKGDSVVITTEEEGVRFLLISGKPIKEPVAWYGPIVMNTQEELRVAFDEFRSGNFIKYK